MKKLFILLLITFESLAIWPTTQPKLIVIGNGNPITPKHDGIHYFINDNNKPINDSVSVEKVINAFKMARQAGKVVYDFLSINIAGDLPVIVTKELGGVSYEILLDKLVFTPSGNTISIAALITKPNGDSYAFGGENVRFTGQGGIESGTLNLLIDNNLELKTQQLNSKVKVNITGGGFSFGCDGFENVSLFGRVTFDRELLVPESNDPDTDFIHPSDVISSNFRLEKISDFNDMVIEISMPPFQITKMPGFGFEVDKAIIDLSAKNNAAFFRLPKGYIPDIEGTGWMGVAIISLKVKLPAHFVNRKTQLRSEIQVNDLLIDRYGFSGEVIGKNFLTLEEGDLSGWDISIHSLGLNFIKNQVTGGAIEGKIRPSVVKNEEQALQYKAQFDPVRNYYNFAVFVTDTLEFPFLKAGAVTLTPNSSIKLSLAEKRFHARANLSGELNIKADELTLKKYTFTSLIVSTRPPYLFVGYFGKSTSITNTVNDTTKTDVFNGFSVVMKEPKIVKNEENIAVRFGLMVNLDRMGIAAEGDFIIEGQLEKRSNRHYWVNKSFAVGTISVSADINPIKFRGQVDFIKNDPIYGKAFYGKLAAELNFGKKYEVKAAALFGNKEKNPYWFVDLMYEPTSGNTSGISINLLSGFFYKHMKASGGQGPLTLTGMLYQPDFNINWGAKAAVGFSMAGETSMQAFGGLEVEARANNSISKIGIMANVSIANQSSNLDPNLVKNIFFSMSQSSQLAVKGGITSKLEKNPKDENTKEEFKILSPPPSPTFGFSAFAMIKFDFDQKSFYGELGADFTIKNATRIAGMGAILVSPDKNFLHLGEPPAGRRILVKATGLPQFDAYFMIGDIVPELPAPYPNIFDLYPQELSKRTPNNVSLVSSGKGIAFGAAVEVSNSNSFKLLSWNLGARAGLDMVLVKYPQGSYCYGYPGAELGINNWRAMGQVYMLGWFDFQAMGLPVLNLTLGALLKGSTPNPTYATGQVAVSFRLLFKKYDYRAKFQIGDECEVVTGEENITQDPIISATFPSAGQTISDEKLIYIETIEDFNKNLELPELRNPTQLKMVSYKLFKGSEELNGQYTINNNNAYYITGRPLENNTKYTYTVKVQVQEMTGGLWKPLVLDGKEISETRTGTFTFFKSAEQLADELADAGEDAAQNISNISEENLSILNYYLADDKDKIKNLSTKAINAIDAMLDACGSQDTTCQKIALVASGIIKKSEDSTINNIINLETQYSAKIRAAIALDSSLAQQAGYAAQLEILKNGQQRLNNDFTKFKQNFYTQIGSIPCAQSYLQQQGITFNQFLSDPSVLFKLNNQASPCLEQLMALKNQFIAEKERLLNYYTQINNGIINNTIEEIKKLQIQAAAKARSLVDEATHLSQAEKDRFYNLVDATVRGAFYKFSSMDGFEQKFDTQDQDNYIKKFESNYADGPPTISCDKLSEPHAPQFFLVGDQLADITLRAQNCIDGSRYRWDYINKDNMLKSIEGNNVTINDFNLSTTFTVACVSKGCESGRKKDNFVISIQKSKPDGCKYIDAPTILYSSLNITKGDSVSITAKGCATGYQWSTGAQTDQLQSVQVFDPQITTSYWVKCLDNSTTLRDGPKILDEDRDAGDRILPPTASSACKDEYLKHSFTVHVKDGCQSTTPYALVQNVALAENEKFELKAFGCPDGKFFWTTGVSPQPSDVNINPLIIYGEKNTQYRVYCKNNLCVSGLSEKIGISIVEKNQNGQCVFEKPVIVASRTVITDIEDPTQGIVFTASGCPVGSRYQWSLKDPLGNSYTGSTISILTPSQPFYVTVNCLFSTCTGVNSDPLSIQINDPCKGLKYPGIISNATTGSVMTGTPLTLTAINCPTEHLRWSNGIQGVQSIEFVADVTSQTRSYSVSCQKDGCPKTHFSANHSFEVLPCDISPIMVFANNTQYLIYDPNDGSTKNSLTVTASGCNNAQIRWEMYGRYLSNQPTVSINIDRFENTNNGETAPLRLICSRNYCETREASTTVRVLHFDHCRTILNYSLSILANKNTHQGEGITLSAAGCPHNVYWSDGQQGHSITTYHRGNITYSASCSITNCSGSISSNSIDLYYHDPCAAYYNGPSIYQPNDGTQSLEAYNCLNNAYMWNTGHNQARIKVFSSGNYSVSCSDHGCGSFSSSYFWEAPAPPAPPEPDVITTPPGNSGDGSDHPPAPPPPPVQYDPPVQSPPGGVVYPLDLNKKLNPDIP